MRELTLYTAATSGNAKNTVYPTVAHISDRDRMEIHLKCGVTIEKEMK